MLDTTSGKTTQPSATPGHFVPGAAVATVWPCDVFEALSLMPSESVDCVIADPPYNETSLAWDRWPSEWPSAVRRVLKRSGSMWVFGSQRMFLDRIDEFDGWRFSQDIIWEKQNGSSAAADRFRRVHEHVLLFYRTDSPWGGVYKDVQYTLDATARRVRRKQKPPHWGVLDGSSYTSEDGGPRLMRSVLQVRSEHGRALHPTQKPLGIVEPLLRYSCPPGGLVLDPFAGSGTTGVAALRNGRSADLIEINPDYCKIIAKRLETLT